MYNIGFWNCIDYQNNKNYFFKSKREDILGENSIETLRSLFSKKKSFDYNIEFLDLKYFFDYDAIIFSNWPYNKKIEKLLKKRIKPNYLLATEGPTIDKNTWKKSNHLYFKKVFTWDDSLVNSDRNKYIKINFPCYKEKNYKTNFKKKKFLISISSNKKNSHINDLYRERLAFINWAEKNNFFEFDFYGFGWNKYLTDNKYLLKFLSTFKFLNFLFIKKYKNYKGEYYGIKQNLMKKYKFAICFENSKNYNGWVTEKIFHCFFSGCVPIYYGAKNISNIIPQNCYIDYKMFKNKKKLILYLQSLTDKDLDLFKKNIFSYLQSKKFNENFTLEVFFKTVFNEIKKDLK